MVKERKIPEGAANWVRAAVDPYHDFAITPGGVPDGRLTQSCVKCVSRKLNFAAPVGVTTAWHALIHTNPWDSASDESPALAYSKLWLERSGLIDIDPTSFGQATGIVQVNTAAATFDVFPSSNTFDQDDVTSVAINTGRSVLGRARIVGMGIEITNTTPELYKGGSLTVARRNIISPTSQELGTTTTDPLARTTGFIYQGMPQSDDQLFNLPGAKTWNAMHGVYCVIPPDSSGYELRDVDSQLTQRIMSSKGIPVIDAYKGAAFAPNAATPVSSRANIRASGISQTLVYLSGLAPESTFTLTSRMYFEYLPYSNSSEIYFMRPATPSCPEALQLAELIYKQMPPGVPVGDNAGGDWFRWVSRAIQVAVPAVFPSTRPALAAASPVIKKITEQVASKLDKRAEGKKKSKKKKTKKK